MRIDELDRKLHERGHADCGFHVVAEHEECAACRIHASVEHDAVHDTCHREFRHTGLKETAGEIILYKFAGLLEKAVGLVAVGEIRARNDHIADMLCEKSETSGRGGTCGLSGLDFDLTPVEVREFETLVSAKQFRFRRVFFRPSAESCASLRNDSLQLGSAVFI